jgi:3-dehydroquinate synthase
LQASDFVVSQLLIGDGERFKTLGTAEHAIGQLSEAGLERNDAVLALGGGVVGDLTGFVASVYLRGIAFIQAPTTLLAQIDASIGGKTAVNSPLGKNLIGSFHQPSVVLIDIETLSSLPSRELVAGFCECVKQATVASRKLFVETRDFLDRLRSNRVPLISTELQKLIAKHCSFKASIVAGDAQESISRTDRRSRRILNFGHTVGHALEAVTGYRRFRHGEAVGLGMLVAGELSKNLGLLEELELKSLREAIRLCGPLPRVDDLDEDTILDLISRDKKSLSGQVQWVLLESIGHARILDGKHVTRRLLKHSLRSSWREI